MTSSLPPSLPLYITFGCFWFLPSISLVVTFIKTPCVGRGEGGKRKPYCHLSFLLSLLSFLPQSPSFRDTKGLPPAGTFDSRPTSCLFKTTLNTPDTPQNQILSLHAFNHPAPFSYTLSFNLTFISPSSISIIILVITPPSHPPSLPPSLSSYHPCPPTSTALGDCHPSLVAAAAAAAAAPAAAAAAAPSLSPSLPSGKPSTCWALRLML